MPNIISAHSSNIIRKGKGIDPVLQENKAVNLKLASSKINGIIIRPGETFSFWKTVGKATRKKGDKYYRSSKIYRNAIEKSTENILSKELIWDNNSIVMYDYDLIPKELIKKIIFNLRKVIALKAEQSFFVLKK